MAANSRLAVAIHILAFLACHPDEWVSSERIATSVNTHPVVIRRLLSLLTQAELVTTQAGKAGGSRLSRKPEQVSLAEIYGAVEESCLFAHHPKASTVSCPIGDGIQAALQEAFKAAEIAVKEKFVTISLADLVHKVMDLTPERTPHSRL